MRYICLLLCFSSLIFWSSCADDDINTSGDVTLEFSLDTLRFDTVFTTVGSATRFIKVYNRNDRPIQISSIKLAGNAGNTFRLNIDGLSTDEARDVYIAENDSLYIFAETTIDPDAPLSESPFVIEDQINFVINGNNQAVYLEAWGQNANYIPNRQGAGGAVVLSCDFMTETWDDPRPYVIYGVLVIDECELVLPAGTEVYVHGGLTRVFDGENLTNDGLIVVEKDGKLKAEGTIDNPVVFQGDRLEEEFEDIQGQWLGILFLSESTGNEFHYTDIKNSIISVRADSAAQVSLYNSRLYNNAGAGLTGINADIYAENCLLYNNFSGGVYFEYGGNYELNYCTVASYGGNSNAAALVARNWICLKPVPPNGCDDLRVDDLNAVFRNCIFFGSKRDEIAIDNAQGAAANYTLENCVVRYDELLDAVPDFPDNCNDCINATPDNALFTEADEMDYSLDTLSIANGTAMPIPSILLDLENKTRNTSTPDIGALERID